MESKKPNLFVVGKAKSGTTSLYSLLYQHPDIFMSEIKEPSYFGRQKKRRKYPKNEGEYLELFQKSKNEKYRGEATPGYIEKKEVAKKIKEFNPESKIIIILREPIDFLVSLYQHRLLKDNKKPSKKAFLEFFQNNLDKVDYKNQIGRFAKNFPSKNIEIILYEEFKKDNLGIFEEVCQFLGIKKYSPFVSTRNPSRQRRENFISRKIKNFHKKTIKYTSRRNLEKIFGKNITSFITYVYYNSVFKLRKWEPDKKTKKELRKKIKPKVKDTSNFLKKKGFIDRDLVKYWGYKNL